MSETAPKSTLDSILDQYKTNTSSATANYSKKTYDLKNYFTTFLEKGVDSAKKVIRILPTKDGGTPFVELMVHKIKVNGEYKTYPCLKHEEQKECPFCEAREALLATGQASDKELAKTYSSKKTYVVKVIDRNAETEGVKFWRFSHDYRKTGTLDKIIGIIQEVGDIVNANTGRDLTINIARDTNKIPVIQSIIQKDPSKLTTSRETGLSWLADERTWRDVYSVKPYDYLYLIVKGLEPAWDKVNNKWADKATLKADNVGNESDELAAELETGKAKAAEAKVTTSNTNKVEDEDNDLPF